MKEVSCLVSPLEKINFRGPERKTHLFPYVFSGMSVTIERICLTVWWGGHIYVHGSQKFPILLLVQDLELRMRV